MISSKQILLYFYLQYYIYNTNLVIRHMKYKNKGNSGG